MEHEIWKTAVYIYENGHKEVFEKYQVSSLGRVKSLDYNHTGKEGILSTCSYTAKDGTTLCRVSLCKNSKIYSIQLHRLVLSSFDSKSWFPGAVVNHKVERTSDCDDSLANLEWMTQQQNTSTPHCKALRSKRIKVTDLSTGEVTEYSSSYDAGRSLGINVCTAANCIKYQDGYYKKLNLHFEYL